MSRTGLAGAACLAAALLVGCAAPGDRYMPLEPGSEWTYTVQLHFKSVIARLKVKEQAPVGSGMGWRLAGDLGESRMAWRAGKLIAAELGGTKFDPPITLLDPTAKEAPQADWKGVIRHAGKQIPAAGTLSQTVLTDEADKLQIGSRKFSSIRSRLEVKAEGANLELTTWFAPGVGIIRQEQRINGDLVPSLEYLSGP